MRNEVEAMSRMFRALGHPTRLRVLELLAAGPWCVCEMLPHLGVEQSNLSKHLSVLRREGLISGEKDGLRIVYRLNSPLLPGLIEQGMALLVQGEEVSHTTPER